MCLTEASPHRSLCSGTPAPGQPTSTTLSGPLWAAGAQGSRVCCIPQRNHCRRISAPVLRRDGIHAGAVTQLVSRPAGCSTQAAHIKTQAGEYASYVRAALAALRSTPNQPHPPPSTPMLAGGIWNVTTPGRRNSCRKFRPRGRPRELAVATAAMISFIPRCCPRRLTGGPPDGPCVGSRGGEGGCGHKCVPGMQLRLICSTACACAGDACGRPHALAEKCPCSLAMRPHPHAKAPHRPQRPSA